MKLTKYEQETIINWNLEEAVGYVSTRMPAVMRYLEKQGIKPTEIHKDKTTNRIYGKDYVIPKKYIRLPRIPKKRTMTEEQREASGKRLAKAREHRSE